MDGVRGCEREEHLRKTAGSSGIEPPQQMRANFHFKYEMDHPDVIKKLLDFVDQLHKFVDS